MRKLVILTVLIATACAAAQTESGAGAPSGLPSAPRPQPGSVPPNAPLSSPQTIAPQSNPGTSPLSLHDAQALALKNNPQISVARLTALASQQVTREFRSNLWPTATVDLTAVDSNPGSRITAGALNNPTVYPRAAAGASVTQLITDFGRTTNLISSAKLAAKAENQNAIATREQILLAVNQSFFNALQAQAVLTVAQQTVNERQTVSSQVDALFKSKLKSELDLSFANVNLAQAKLLLLDATNNENAALANLSAVLGFSNLQIFRLVEDTSPATAPPANVDELISTALTVRPEILALEFQSESASKFQKAERDLLFPNIRALGVVGDTPVRDPIISPNWYGAVGVNVEVPVFNGFLFNARSREATLREEATRERLRDLRDRISRDVRTSWLNANTAYQRLAVTQQLLDQANLALNLAQTRYHLGLGSIVELSQGQLQLTQAQISQAQAMYDYRLALAVLRYQTSGI
jgi:outer membrane protein